MKNAEASTATDTAATVAAQGATVAPEEASSKKAASQSKGAPKGQHAAKGAKTKPDSKKKAKPHSAATAGLTDSNDLFSRLASLRRAAISPGE